MGCKPLLTSSVPPIYSISSRNTSCFLHLVLLHNIPYLDGIQAASYIQCFSTKFHIYQGYKLLPTSSTTSQYSIHLGGIQAASYIQCFSTIFHLSGIQAASYIQYYSTIFHTSMGFKLLLTSSASPLYSIYQGYKLLLTSSTAPIYSISIRDTSCFLHPVLLFYFLYLEKNLSCFLHLVLLHYIPYLSGIQGASYI